MSTHERKPFDIDPKAVEWVDLEFLKLVADWGHLAMSYREAAEELVDAATTGRRSDDALYLPTAFLYRHALECYMKGFIEAGCFLLKKSPPEVMGGHHLRSLWNEAKKRLVCLGWENGDLTVADPVIREFDKLDPRGMSFRYHKGKKGNELLSSAPKHVNATSIKSAIDPVFEAFEELEAILDHMIDDRLSDDSQSTPIA